MPSRRVLLAVLLSFAAHGVAGVCLIAAVRPSAAVPFKTAVPMEISLIAGVEEKSNRLSPPLSRHAGAVPPQESAPPDRFTRTEVESGFRAAGSAVVLASLGSVSDLKPGGGGAAAAPGPVSGNDSGRPPSSGPGKAVQTNPAGKTGMPSSERTVPPRYRGQALPPYPWLARLKGQEGLTLLSAEILPDGTVGSVRIRASSGHALLDRSALETIRGWRFEPGLKGGAPAAMWVDVPVRFSLHSE